jgi:hypothetical protein
MCDFSPESGNSQGLMTLRGVNEKCIEPHQKHCRYVLDSGAIGTSGELSVDEDARGEAKLALERLGVEVMSKGSG